MFVRSAFPVNLTKFFFFSVFNQASICQSSRNNFWCAEGRWSVKESYEGIRYKTQKCPLKSLYGLLCPSFPQPPSPLGLAYMVTWLIHTKTRLKIINLCTPQSTWTASLIPLVTSSLLYIVETRLVQEEEIFRTIPKWVRFSQRGERKTQKNYVIWNRWFCDENLVFCSTHQYTSFQIISGPRGVWGFVKTLPNLIKHGPGLKIYVSGVYDYEIASFSYSQSKMYICAKEMHVRRMIFGYQRSFRR